MDELLLALRLLLAAIFGVAGVTKFADLSGTRKSLSDFGVPLSLIPISSVLLPLAELAVAAGVLFIDRSWFAAVGALVLLSIFSAGMIVQIVRGNTPDCHCFGQLHSEPVSKKSLVRNLIFMVPPVVLIVVGRAGQGLPISQMTRETIQLYLLGTAVLMLGAILMHLRSLAKKQDEILKRIDAVEVGHRDDHEVRRDDAGDPRDGLPIGAPLPVFELTLLHGGAVRTDSFGENRRPTLLLFVNPACGPCRALMPKAAEWAVEFAGKVDLRIVSTGTPEENEEAFEIDSEIAVLLQQDREFANAVGGLWNPSGLLVSADCRIASHIAAGDSAIETLVQKIREKELGGEFDYVEFRNGDEPHAKIRIGESIPEFSVKDIAGEMIKGADLKGKPTLIAFWSPGCSHCVGMIDQFRKFDRVRSDEDPGLLIFSDGDLELHREMELRSPIVLDKNYKTAQKLGMHGTPSAILIGSDGRFASELAIGAPNIWALVGRRVSELN